MRRRLGVALGLLAAAALLPGVARAADVSVTIPSVALPLRAGVTHRNTASAPASTLAFDVVNGRNGALRLVELTLPSNYEVSAITAPAGWYAASTSGRVIQFRTTSCTGAGIARGASGRFQINVTPPASGAANDVTESIAVRAGTCTSRLFGLWPDWTSNWSTSAPTFVRHVLRLGAPSASEGFGTATVSWPITNLSSASKTIALDRGAVAGLSASASCTTPTLTAGQSGTIRCTYANPTPGTYTFTAGATATASSTAMGATGSVSLGVLRAAWRSPAGVVLGRPPYAFTFDLGDSSSSPQVSKVEVIPAAGWTGAAAAAGSAGLAPSTDCTAGAACFGGAMNAATATLTLTVSGVPAVSATTPYTFTVRVTSGGVTSETTQQLRLFVPPQDVSGLTILSSQSSGQVLTWANREPHDGVVIFRSATSAPPARPVDFVDYTDAEHRGEVAYAEPHAAPDRQADTTWSDFSPDARDAHFYRVCSRDANLVYSDCKTGFWNGEGYADSVPPPASGWSHQLGSEAAYLPTLVGNRVAVFSHVPQQVTILDLPTGNRLFDPFPLPGIPSNRAVATKTSDSHPVVFVSDQSGSVRAIDLATGDVRWRIETGESFVAGVAGIGKSTAHPDFQAAYDADVLLLGSTSGNVLGIDTRDGTILWHVDAGAPVNALITYVAASNRFYVPTDAGVAAFALQGSAPGQDHAPENLELRTDTTRWVRPSGAYTMFCTTTWESNRIACIDRTGVLSVLDETGHTVASRATGLASPTSLVRLTGTSPGFVVGNSKTVMRLVPGTPELGLAGSWSPSSGVISSTTVFTNGSIVVSGSGGLLYKLQVADARWIADSPNPLPAAVISARKLGASAYDSTDHFFVFGTNEGRIWAIPYF